MRTKSNFKDSALLIVLLSDVHYSIITEDFKSTIAKKACANHSLRNSQTYCWNYTMDALPIVL